MRSLSSTVPAPQVRCSNGVSSNMHANFGFYHELNCEPFVPKSRTLGNHCATLCFNVKALSDVSVRIKALIAVFAMANPSFN